MIQIKKYTYDKSSLSGRFEILESWQANTTAARTSSENVTTRFCNPFSIIQSHYACKMCFNYRRIKSSTSEIRKQNCTFVNIMLTSPTQLQNRSFHVVHRGKNENVCEMSKNEKCTSKA